MKEYEPKAPVIFEGQEYDCLCNFLPEDRWYRVTVTYGSRSIKHGVAVGYRDRVNGMRPGVGFGGEVLVRFDDGEGVASVHPSVLTRI